MKNSIRNLLVTLISIICFCCSCVTEPQESSTEQSVKINVIESRSIVANGVEIPAYSGEPYCIVNNDVPFFSDSDKKSTEPFEEYSELDKLGRCGVAYANICKELMPDDARGSIGQVKPSGWHTVKYNGVVNGNYLYNRCHLIGFQLAGENANPKNLITGTRYLNIDGMLEHENQVANYVEVYGNHVLYRVTPIFYQDNLVADGVLMEGYSVEDKGKGVQFCVFAYNVQPHIYIDYKTGESCLASETNNEIHNEELVLSGEEQTYILNTKTNKFHKPSCSSVTNMKEENKAEYIGLADELILEGYEPCGKCKPE